MPAPAPCRVFSLVATVSRLLSFQGQHGLALPEWLPMSTTDSIVLVGPTVERTVPVRAELRPGRRRAIVTAVLVGGDLFFSGLAGLFPQLITGWLPAEHWLGSSTPVPIPPVALVFVLAAFGLYSSYGPSPPERFRLRVLGIGIYAIGCLLVASALGTSARGVADIAVVSALLIVIGFYGESALRSALIRWKLWGALTVIVGADTAGRDLANTLLAQPELGFRPVGFLVEPGQESIRTEGLPVLGGIDESPAVPAEVLLFSSCATLALYDGKGTGQLPAPRTVLVQQIHELQNMWVQVQPLGSAIGLEIRRELYRSRNLALKRVIDCTLGGIGLILALPVIAILAATIRVLDPGSPFYVQIRVGRDGRPIRVLKLRTMYSDAERRLHAHLEACPAAREEWRRFFKLSDDPRILPKIGNFIRRTSLDELPQLWNVVRGDMSLVGPRPFPAYHMDGFDSDFRTLRTSVPPGLTGLWQISSRSDGDLGVQRSQDTYYIRNWSPWLDLYILLATVSAVLGAKGAR